MIPIVVAASAWHLERTRVTALLARLAHGDGTAAVVVDLATARREPPADAAMAMPPLHEIDFARWVRPGLDPEGVLDAAAVRRAGDGVAADHIVLLDARSQHRERLVQALGYLREAWFELEQWHPAFVLVCDDHELLAVADALAGTFYCQPQPMTDAEINRIVRQMARRALAARFLGPSVVAWQRKRLYKVLQRYYDWSDRRAERLETRR